MVVNLPKECFEEHIFPFLRSYLENLISDFYAITTHLDHSVIMIKQVVII